MRRNKLVAGRTRWSFTVGAVFWLGISGGAVADPEAAPSAPFEHHRFALNDADPVSSVPPLADRNAHPLQFGYFIQDILDHAQAAMKAGNDVAALRYYDAITKAVPERAIGFSRLCQLLEKTKQRPAALVACRTAVGLPGVVVDDYVRFVRLLLAAPDPLPPKDVDDVKAVIGHLRAEPDAKMASYQVQCDLGIRQGDAAALEECTAGLSAAAPTDPRTISYRWALAMQKRDSDEARQLIRKATELGMPAAAVNLMTQQTDAQFSRWSQRLADWQFSAPLAVAVCAGAASVVALARRRRLSRHRPA